MSGLATLESAGPAGTGEAAEIRRLGPWFHNLHLPDGTETAPDHPLGDFPACKWREIASHLLRDLAGRSVLDVGCNAGFYSFELARRGADVLALEPDPRYLAQARWARERLGVASTPSPGAGSVRFERRTVYELPLVAGRFDLVLFLGVFYHLRYPLLALEMVAEKVGRRLLFQTLSLPPAPEGDAGAAGTAGLGFEDRDRLADPTWPRMAFVEHDFAGDPTNWWVPNRAACEALLRSAGLRVLARPAEETYLCEPAHDREASSSPTERPWRASLGPLFEGAVP